MTHIGPSPRILIVRLSAIGDVIQTMPIACALRERFPGAFLAWVVQRRGAELLEGHEALDELIALPQGWLKSPRAVWQLRRRLRAMNFDIVVEAQGLTKAAIVAWLSGSRRRIGFGGCWGRELSPWLNTETVDTGDLHAVDRNLGLLRPLGIESPGVRFCIPEHRADRLATEQIIRKACVGERFAIINAGAGWPSKQWPAERFAAVARHLGGHRRLPTLILGGSESERRMAVPPETREERIRASRCCECMLTSILNASVQKEGMILAPSPRPTYVVLFSSVGGGLTRQRQRRLTMADLVANRSAGNGGGGIRTPETVTRLTVFKTVAFSRSATPPNAFDLIRGLNPHAY